MRLFSSYRPTEVQSLRSLNITQGSSGSVGKRSKASGLVPERDEESSRGQRPRKPVELPTLKGSHPAEPGFNLCDLVRRVRPRVGTQTFAFRGRCPRQLTSCLSGHVHTRHRPRRPFCTPPRFSRQASAPAHALSAAQPLGGKATKIRRP